MSWSATWRRWGSPARASCAPGRSTASAARIGPASGGCCACSGRSPRCSLRRRGPSRPRWWRARGSGPPSILRPGRCGTRRGSCSGSARPTVELARAIAGRESMAAAPRSSAWRRATPQLTMRPCDGTSLPHRGRAVSRAALAGLLALSACGSPEEKLSSAARRCAPPSTAPRALRPRSRRPARPARGRHGRAGDRGGPATRRRARPLALRAALPGDGAWRARLRLLEPG